jgi:hypothetical protein
MKKLTVSLLIACLSIITLTQCGGEEPRSQSEVNPEAIMSFGPTAHSPISGKNAAEVPGETALTRLNASLNHFQVYRSHAPRALVTMQNAQGQTVKWPACSAARLIALSAQPVIVSPAS